MCYYKWRNNCEVIFPHSRNYLYKHAPQILLIIMNLVSANNLDHARFSEMIYDNNTPWGALIMIHNYSVTNSAAVYFIMKKGELEGKIINGHKILKMLTSTAYSRLYICESSKERPLCAKAMLKTENQIGNSTQDQIFMTEASALQILQNPYIITMHDVAVDEEYFYLFMDFFRDGSLAHLLYRTPCLKEQNTKTIFYYLCEALQYIHSRNVAHRNINPSNILINKGSIILSDFGLTSLESRKMAQPQNIVYMAPESFEGGPYDEKAADIWSAGVVLFEMSSGKIPWSNFNNQNELIHQIKRGTYSFPPRTSQQVRSLITKMLDLNPNTRIGVQQIFAHPWIFQTRKNLTHSKDNMRNIVNGLGCNSKVNFTPKPIVPSKAKKPASVLSYTVNTSY